jgi:hypothetical protein
MRITGTATSRFFVVAGVWFGAAVFAVLTVGGHAGITLSGPATATAFAGTFGGLLSFSATRLRVMRRWLRVVLVSVIALVPVATFFAGLGALGEPFAAVSLVAPFALVALACASIVEWLCGGRTVAGESSAT